MHKILFTGLIGLLLGACTPHSTPQAVDQRFEQMPAERTGLDFNNQISESPDLNYYVFPYLYLGGGVATGDFNNDGLIDLFFTGNMVENKLYLNQGDWRFKDISRTAGLQGDGRWYTGVTLVDINQDGWLDIYLSVSGKGINKRNQLFINQGAEDRDPASTITFEEAGVKWGIADPGPSIQSAFFDYDQDGDLDLYVANYPPAPFGSSNAYYLRKMRNLAWEDSDHLYQNTGEGAFVDVSQSSGIANYGLSLGLSIGDFNQDGLDDIYVSNDFSTPDRFFFNQGDGSFRDEALQSLTQTALFGMGCDAADFNNDGLLDLMQVDMTPQDNRRSKENMAGMNPRLFWQTVESGFHHQYMYNSLQLNRGSNTSGQQLFSQVSRIAGMGSTDWSWASLFADLDNDGWKDLFITNGIKRDVNNRDFINAMKMKINFTQRFDSIAYEQIPSEPIPNYAYRNEGQLSFTEKGETWGLNQKGFSHGAAYADLDNDGDLDLVTNNMDQPAGLFQNKVAQGNYIQFKMEGPPGNRNGIGTKVWLFYGDSQQYQQLSLSRGFQSAVSPVLHFGLGDRQQIDQFRVQWPDGSEQILDQLAVNQVVQLKHAAAQFPPGNPSHSPPLFRAMDVSPIPFKHSENSYDDYSLEPLLPYQYSRLGPGLATADVNEDGLEDVFIGNAYKQTARLFIQLPDDRFQVLPGPWEADSLLEDQDALFFDADGDGDLDLLVGHGGHEFLGAPEMMQDKLYINLGQGKFSACPQCLPAYIANTSCIRAEDYDRDGDTDLFIGARTIPGKYPLPASSILLQNDGGRDMQLRFAEATKTALPELAEIGMVTDACWADMNGDSQPDLMVVGEWMGVQLFLNQNGSFSSHSQAYGLHEQIGWWQSVAVADLDLDGDMDLVVGNIGRNFKYKATDKAPFSVYSGDFDGNGRLDIVLGYQQAGEQFPLRGRQCSSEQIPAIAMKFKDYHSFAVATLPEIYGPQNLQNALQYHANTFASYWVEQQAEGKWTFHELPALAQISSVNDILISDLNQDDFPDILIGGNLYRTEVETPRNDASLGLVLLNDTKASFVAQEATTSGLFLKGDIKSLQMLRLGPVDQPNVLLGAGNNEEIQLFRLQNER